MLCRRHGLCLQGGFLLNGWWAAVGCNGMGLVQEYLQIWQQSTGYRADPLGDEGLCIPVELVACSDELALCCVQCCVCFMPVS